ncbi:hypothetical protein B0H16DRAFT_341916 [Mycena metata]|uniref:G protein-coupled receptor GPR1/2/3 C-terminal domain-containing protein n=1 Tax=Mycena metata TaxID=1033252 RepID=A0AAD7HM56_9AGAR|nr:hypothetical protein B0H16DRAFT_341916 [Mycena metata]
MAQTDYVMLQLVYTLSQRNGIIPLVASGLLSGIAVIYLLLTILTYSKRYSSTHFLLYFVCLLLADVMQSAGSIISLSWLQHGGVYDGPLCAAQGGLKQGGNIAAAVWSFVISFHLFNLLFLRYETPKYISWSVVAFGWSFVFSMVFLGPVAIENPKLGPFFGISGEWCWITSQYKLEQIFMQYLFEFTSVIFSTFLYTATLLRARGNLIKVDGRWVLRFLSAGDSWQLDFGRDFTDAASLRLIKHMIWYPVAYAALIMPIALVRISEFAGSKPAFWVTVVADLIFNLFGFVDVVLFFSVYRVFPETASLPEFSRRKTVDLSVIQYGITPFSLSESEPKPMSPTYSGRGRPNSTASMSSINSQTPLRP